MWHHQRRQAGVDGAPLDVDSTAVPVVKQEALAPGNRDGGDGGGEDIAKAFKLMKSGDGYDQGAGLDAMRNVGSSVLGEHSGQLIQYFEDACAADE